MWGWPGRVGMRQIRQACVTVWRHAECTELRCAVLHLALTPALCPALLALAAAARYPDRIAAAASFYGTWLVSENEESPHLSFGKVKGELYISCAEHDELAPLPMVEQLNSLFKSSGVTGELEIHPGVHHGFAFPQRKIYDKPAAERHWERLIALYRRRLG